MPHSQSGSSDSETVSGDSEDALSDFGDVSDDFKEATSDPEENFYRERLHILERLCKHVSPFLLPRLSPIIERVGYSEYLRLPTLKRLKERLQPLRMLNVAKGCLVRAPRQGVVIMLTPTYIPARKGAYKPYEHDGLPFSDGETANIFSKKNKRWIYRGTYQAVHVETIRLEEASLLSPYENVSRQRGIVEIKSHSERMCKMLEDGTSQLLATVLAFKGVDKELVKSIAEIRVEEKQMRTEQNRKRRQARLDNAKRRSAAQSALAAANKGPVQKKQVKKAVRKWSRGAKRAKKSAQG